MNVCMNVARFVHVESRFDKIRDISQGLHRSLSDTFTSASMSLVQIMVIYDYNSSKRVTHSYRRRNFWSTISKRSRNVS